LANGLKTPGAGFIPNSEVARGFIGILTTDYRHFTDLTSLGSYTREGNEKFMGIVAADCLTTTRFSHRP